MVEELTGKQGIKEMPDIINAHFGKLADTKQSLVALNTAMSNEGAFVYVKNGVKLDKLVQILFVNTNQEESRMMQTRNLFVLEDFAEAQIFERHQNLDQVHNHSYTSMLA